MSSNKDKIRFTEKQKIKAQKRGSRLAELEFGPSSGSFHKVHATAKEYKRSKNKKINFEDE